MSNRRSKQAGRLRRLTVGKARLNIAHPRGALDHDQLVFGLAAPGARPPRRYPCGCLERVPRRDCAVHRAGVEAGDAGRIEDGRRQDWVGARDRWNDRLLLSVLSIAVPMWIERMQGWESETRRRVASGFADLIAYKGDVLMYGSKQEGAAAEQFNAVAMALAAGAFLPGGVTFCGLHWEAAPAPVPVEAAP